jgi:hypothetical protein
MKKLAYIFILTLLSSCGFSSISEEDLLQSINSTPMVYTVECMAQTCVVERSDLFSSLLGQRTAIIPVQANIKAGIDLSKVTNVKIAEGKAFITLPSPTIEIESTKVLNDQIVTSVGSFRSNFSAEELTEIASKGREAIEQKLYEYDLIEPAQDQAEVIIGSIVRKMGLEPVFERHPVYENQELIRFVSPHQ